MKTVYLTIICLFFVCIVNFSNSQKTIYDFERQSGCFNGFLNQKIGVLQNYKDSLQGCNNEGNSDRLPPLNIDTQAEIEKCKEMSWVTCNKQSACNIIADTNDFLRCHSKSASANMLEYMEIYLNATAMAFELNKDYQVKEKEILRCQLKATRTYVSSSMNAYKELLKCKKPQKP